MPLGYLLAAPEEFFQLGSRRILHLRRRRFFVNGPRTRAPREIGKKDFGCGVLHNRPVPFRQGTQSEFYSIRFDHPHQFSFDQDLAKSGLATHDNLKKFIDSQWR